MQRQIDRLLDEAEGAITNLDWEVVRARALAVLRLGPGNSDEVSYLSAADRDIEGISDTTSARPATPSVEPVPDVPTSFADGRYQVERFLGEGGKKMVYLAHDNLLDREVAFALIKTEGLDDASRERVAREPQAMGRLGSHPHIVTVFGLGEHDGTPYCCQSANVGRIRTRENCRYGEPALSSLAAEL